MERFTFLLPPVGTFYFSNISVCGLSGALSSACVFLLLLLPSPSAVWLTPVSHLHTFLHDNSHVRYVHLYTPRSSSLWQQFTSWLTGNPPEFFDSKFIAQGKGREGMVCFCFSFALLLVLLFSISCSVLIGLFLSSLFLPLYVFFTYPAPSSPHCFNYTYSHTHSSPSSTVTRVRSNGAIKVVFNVTLKNMADFGYDVNGDPSQRMAREDKSVNMLDNTRPRSRLGSPSVLGSKVASPRSPAAPLREGTPLSRRIERVPLSPKRSSRDHNRDDRRGSGARRQYDSSTDE